MKSEFEIFCLKELKHAALSMLRFCGYVSAKLKNKVNNEGEREKQTKEKRKRKVEFRQYLLKCLK